MVHILGGDVIEPVFVKSALETFTILIDTREHETSALTQRIQQMGCPVERQKLNFGDYSAKVILPTGVPYSLENIVVIERKISSDEIANCFTSQRDRFTRELHRKERAKAELESICRSYASKCSALIITYNINDLTPAQRAAFNARQPFHSYQSR